MAEPLEVCGTGSHDSSPAPDEDEVAGAEDKGPTSGADGKILLSCTESRNKRYYPGKEWTHVPEFYIDDAGEHRPNMYEKLNLEKIMQEGNYPKFVNCIRNIRYDQKDPGIKTTIGDCNYLFSTSATPNAEEERCNGTLSSSVSTEHGDLAKKCTRVIIIPSRDMEDIGLSWESASQQLQDSTLMVVLVPEEQHEGYVSSLSRIAHENMPVLVLSNLDDPEHTIGRSRHNIMNIARAWDLDAFWMMDDRVPNNSVMMKARFNEEGVHIEDDSVPIKTVFEETERRFSEEQEPRVAQVGIALSYSVKAIKHFTKDNIVQRNSRAPTACIYTRVKNCEGINYDERLPFKEDIIFSQRLVSARKDVVVFRQFHYTDTRW